jgi:dTMP kinase
MKHPGFLITLEGPEGGGKSPIASEIGKYFSSLGLDILTLAEPGGTRIGQRIRAVLMDTELGEITPKTEALLFQAARAQIVGEKIVPHLLRGGVVLLDRYGDSSEAYQGGGRGLGDAIRKLNRWSTGDLIPDLTLLLDVPVEEGLRRKEKNGERTRIDAEALEFHREVRRQYLIMAAKNDGNRWVVMDASKPLDEVYKEVKEVITKELIARGFIETPHSRIEASG